MHIRWDLPLDRQRAFVCIPKDDGRQIRDTARDPRSINQHQADAVLRAAVQVVRAGIEPERQLASVGQAGSIRGVAAPAACPDAAIASATTNLVGFIMTLLPTDQSQD